MRGKGENLFLLTLHSSLLTSTEGRHMSQKISKDMTFAEVMRMHPEVVRVLSSYNLGCIGCMGAQAESLEQGCNAHGIAVDDLVKDLNAIFQ